MQQRTPIFTLLGIGLALLASLVVIAGSAAASPLLLGDPGAAGSSQGLAEGYIFVIIVIWPLVMLAGWLLGCGALLSSRRPNALAAWFLLCLVAWLCFYAGQLLKIVLSPSTAVPVLIVVFNASFLYATWRFVVRA